MSLICYANVLKRRSERDSRVRGAKRGARGTNDVHPCVSASVSSRVTIGFRGVKANRSDRVSTAT